MDGRMFLEASKQRALDFVLQNQELIDKMLLFNVKLIRVLVWTQRESAVGRW
jgi:hypothetical protein